MKINVYIRDITNEKIFSNVYIHAWYTCKNSRRNDHKRSNITHLLNTLNITVLLIAVCN